MLKIVSSNMFKKDLKLAIKRGLDIDKLRSVVNSIARQETLPKRYKDHNLTGDYKGFRECHIEPDWLLIYEYRKNVLVLVLNRLGSHSELFKK